MDSPADKSRVQINIEDVSFSYGYNPVLSHVSFPIHTGDFLALIGPNGSGKTSLIKIILGLLRPSQGIIRILGKPIDEFNRLRARHL